MPPRRPSRVLLKWSIPMVLLLLCAHSLLYLGCVPQELRQPDTTMGSTSPFRVGPYLLRQQAGQVLVVVQHPLAEPPTVEYWRVCRSCSLDRPEDSQVTLATAERYEGRWVAVLEGLPISRQEKVAYRVLSNAGNTDIRAFTAGAKSDEDFRFAVFGDTRTGHLVHRAVIDAVSRENVDFFVHTGDLVEFGGVDEEWERFFRIEQPLLESTPIFPAVGNHDASTRDHFGQAFLTVLWTDTLHYYYQDWGNLRIVTLDSGIECRGGCTQAYFARKALAEGARRGMLMMMSLHFPPYSSGAHGSYLNLREAVKPLAREYGVELVVAGHDHNYERTRSIDGTTYVVASAAGAPVRAVNPRAFTRAVRTEAHYMLVDADHDRLTLRAVNLDGYTFDAAVVKTNSPTKSLAQLQQDEEKATRLLAKARQSVSWPERPEWARSPR